MKSKLLQIFIFLIIGIVPAHSQSHLESLERIKEHNSKLMESLSEGAYNDFAQGIKLVTNIAHNEDFTKQVEVYWSGLSTKLGDLSDYEIISETTIGKRLFIANIFLYYDLFPVLLRLSYYKNKKGWVLINLKSEENVENYLKEIKQ